MSIKDRFSHHYSVDMDSIMTSNALSTSDFKTSLDNFKISNLHELTNSTTLDEDSCIVINNLWNAIFLFSLKGENIKSFVLNHNPPNSSDEALDVWIDSTVEIMHAMIRILENHNISFYFEGQKISIYFLLLTFLIGEFQGDSGLAKFALSEHFNCFTDPIWPVYLDKYILAHIEHEYIHSESDVDDDYDSLELTINSDSVPISQKNSDDDIIFRN